MNLQPNHEQRELQAELRDLALTCFRPFASKADALGDFPDGFLEQSRVRTLIRSLLPSEHGGGWTLAGGKHLDFDSSAVRRVILNEELAYGDAPLFVALPGLSLAAPIVNAVGSPLQKEKFLSPFLGGDRDLWAAFAMSEPTAGSDVSAMSTHARKENGTYVLNGTKWFIGNGSRAGWAVVFATTNRRIGRFGIKAFLVERGTPGFEATRVLGTLGFRVLQISELRLEDCHIPEANLLTPPAGQYGFDGGMMTFYRFRPAIAAMAVGTARAALDQASEFAQQNGACHGDYWGRVQDRIRELRFRVDAAKLLCWKAAERIDNGLEAFSHICMAKAFGARTVMEVCSYSLQVAGLAGISLAESIVERLARDAKAFDLLEGTGDMQRLMLARNLLKEADAEGRG
jgi:acyl-CoA dehydrogenase